MEGELDAYEYITELQEDQNAVEDAAYQEGSEDHYDVINLYETLQNLNQSILEDEISSEDALFIVESRIKISSIHIDIKLNFDFYKNIRN